MTRHARALVAAGAAAGVALGAVAAIVIPETSADDTATTPVETGPPGVQRVAPARSQPRNGGFVQLRRRGPAAIESRVKDPAGGPDWAVRVFRSDRLTPKGIRRHGVDPVIGRNLCAQLGRMQGTRFGWLDARGTFRPVRIGFRGAPTWCGSRRTDLGGQPTLQVVHTITDPVEPEAAVKATVVWGITGPAARSIDLRLGSRQVRVPLSGQGGFAVVSTGEVRQRDVRGRIAYDGRPAIAVPLRHSGPDRGPGPLTAANGELVARAPDPSGGLPFGLVISRSANGWLCTSTGGRVVGDLVGQVDYELGTLAEGGGGGGCNVPTQKLFRDHPVLLGWSSGAPQAVPGDDPDRGRVMRRTQRGRMIFGGIAAPGVVSVTFASPRDVRTLVPSGPERGIITVYDGSFPTGSFKIIARFQDGRTKTQVLPNMGT